jgi:hypothetical protein
VNKLVPIVTKLGPGDKWQDYGTSWLEVNGQLFAFDVDTSVVERAARIALLKDMQLQYENVYSSPANTKHNPPKPSFIAEWIQRWIEIEEKP